MIAKAIIGSGFGDEGKGLLTDYFASKSNNCLIVRYNGGAQASHTVEMPDGKRHAFSHFGAGTFANAPTFLSKYFIINPILFNKELRELKSLPKVFVDPDCFVTTPYDMILNQIAESNRNGNKHGSCGIGINETVERCQDSQFRLTVRDLFDPIQILEKMIEYINIYLPKRVVKLGILGIPEHSKDIMMNKNILLNWKEDCKQFLNCITLSENDLLKKYDNIIFEGAQGLLLDEKSSYFPHVTRSRTGLNNVIEIAKEVDIKEIDVNYVSRCYATRHGAGPFNNEINEMPYRKIEDKTNKYNEYQGRLRFGWLDLLEMFDYINKDLKQETNISITPSLAITCLDQLDDDNVNFVFNGLEKDTINGFFKTTENIVGIPIKYISYGQTREDIKEI